MLIRSFAVLFVVVGSASVHAVDQTAIDLRLCVGVTPGSERYKVDETKTVGVTLTSDNQVTADPGISLLLVAIAQHPMGNKWGVSYGGSQVVDTHEWERPLTPDGR